MFLFQYKFVLYITIIANFFGFVQSLPWFCVRAASGVEYECYKSIVMRQIFRILKWVFILAVVFGLAFLIYGAVKINQPLATSASEKSFTVAAGEITKQIAKNLEDQGIVSRALFFELQIYLKRQGNKIKAGNYLLSPAMSIREVADILISGKVVNNAVKLTIIEGWTLKDIGTALEDTGVAGAREFEQAENPSPIEGKNWADEFAFLASALPHSSLEGYLFPDTYFFEKGADPEVVVRRMLANFDRKLAPELRDKIRQENKTIHEIVILASIIEKEVGRNVKKGEKLSDTDAKKLTEERRLVAGVFYNRLAAGMGLESDATVGYITGSSSSRATLEETKIDSPYNTYRNRGLPPGPISSPSLDALLAAINPTRTDYLFFLTAPDGTAYFARTLEEHAANRAKYLE